MKNLSIYIVGLTLISMGIGIAAGGYSIEFDPESEPCTKRNDGGCHELKGGNITEGPYPIAGYNCKKYLRSRKCKHCNSNKTTEIEYKGDNCPRNDGPSKCTNEGVASR